MTRSLGRPFLTSPLVLPDSVTLRSCDLATLRCSFSLTRNCRSPVHDSRQAILLDHEKELERRQDDEYEGSEEEVFSLEGDEDDEDDEDEDDLDDLDGDIGDKQDEEDVLDLDSKSLYHGPSHYAQMISLSPNKEHIIETSPCHPSLRGIMGQE